MLNKFGIHIDTADNGEEAIKALSELIYDLVFMDCQMPIMDGYTATRHIRDVNSIVLDNTIPVIAMTAHTMRGDREKCLTAGMNDYLAKPIDFKQLQQILKQWLPEQAQSTQSTPEESNTTIPELEKVSESAIPVLDAVAINQRLMGYVELVRTVAESFLIDMTEQIEILAAMVVSNDVQQATAQAHKIKGASANVGGMKLSAHALKMEEAGKAGDMETFGQKQPELEQCFVQLKAAIEETLL